MAKKKSGKAAAQIGKKGGKRVLAKSRSSNGKTIRGQSPIIVTGGSFKIEASIHEFKDKDNKKGRKYEVVDPVGVSGEIIDITIRDGSKEYLPVKIKNPHDCVIVITYKN